MMSMNEVKRGRGNNARNEKTTFPQVVARQQSAQQRQEAAKKRTPEEQLARLDAAFGPGLGAKKGALKPVDLTVVVANVVPKASKKERRQKRS